MTEKRHTGTVARYSAATAVHLILIALIGFACYARTLQYPFIFDDLDYVVDNPALRQFSIILDPDLAQQGTLSEKLQATLKTRKVAYASFWVNYSVGGLNPAGYRAVNIAVHVVNGFLLYAFIRILMGAIGLVDNGARWSALLCALLFVAHPLQTQAVTYISQRFTAMATMFYLSSTVLYMFACRYGRSLRGVFIYFLSLGAAVLGMATKEITFTLPVMIALLDMAFVKGTLYKRVIRLIPFMITILVIPLSLLDIQGPLVAEARNVMTARADMTRLEYFITQLRVVATYLRLIFFPVGQSIDYAQQPYRSLLDPEIILCGLLHISLAGFAFYSLWRGIAGERRWTLVGAGILWFYITVSVESSVIVLVDLLFEHRAYLPSAGVFMALVAGGSMAARTLRSRDRRLEAWLLLALIVASLTGATIIRNHVWSDTVLIWLEAVDKSPQNPRAQNNLGQAYAEHGMLDKAIEHYRLALSGMRNSAEILSNIGNAYASKNMMSKAFEYYEASIAVNPGSAEAQNNIGVAYAKAGIHDKAIAHYIEAVRLKPYFINAYNNLANSYAAKGMTDKAIEIFRQALAINPANPDIHYNMALSYYEAGMIIQARDEAKIAYSLNDHNDDIRKLLEVLSRTPDK